MRNKVIGVLIFVFIVASALVIRDLSRRGKRIPGLGPGKVEVLKGYVGSEKSNFLENEQVKRILERRYGLKLDYTKAGSIEMVDLELKEDIDFLWPSSQVALELYKMKHAGESVKSEIVLTSPIVIYSWDIVTEALIKAGVVRKTALASLDLDLPQLIRMVREGTTWSEIGLADLYGAVKIISTDPTKSNSGNMFSGLMAGIILGDVATEATVEKALPELKAVFSKLGYMVNSTGILFDQYLRMGVGSFPLIVGYENQIVEFSLEHRDLWPKVKDKMRILYPVPTVWSDHPIIARSARAQKLIEALKDRDLLRLAWEQHGFRTGLMGVDNDPSVLTVVGIPATITKVLPMPAPQVMERIIQAIQEQEPPPAKK